jgi:hypothetical protein
MKLYHIPALTLAAVIGLGAQASASREATPAPREALQPLAGKEYTSYNLISERNIFNSARMSRAARARGEEQKPNRVDSLTFVGVISYEKGPFAFFDGSSADYRKVLAPGKAIAGYKVVEVNPDNVKLESGTNTVTLNIGMQLRREDDGDWQVSGNSPAASASTVSSASSASSADSESDVVKRMMQQREQELK